MTAAEHPHRPLLRVVRGDATPEEIAALIAVLTARSGQACLPARDDAPASTWAAPGFAHRHVRASFTASAHGWRTSHWPR